MAIEEDPPAGVPEWIVTFGDMMSLLLTLFVMLISMSEIKQNDKFQGVASSLREQFRFLRADNSLLADGLRPRSAPLAVLAVSGRDLRRKVIGQSAEWLVEPVGETSAFIASIAFEPAAHELDAAASDRLEQIAPQLAGKPHLVEVRTRFAANGELNLAWQRAWAVARHLIDQGGLERARLRIAVAAQPDPSAISGPARAAEKPMVDVVLLGEPAARVAARPAGKP